MDAAMSSFLRQKQLREEQEEMQEYLKGLEQWTKEVTLRETAALSRATAEVSFASSAPMRGSADMSPLSEARRLKDSGNAHFKAAAFKEAVGDYSLAIAELKVGSQMPTEMAVVLCNRAAAYLKLKAFEKAIADCSAALKLDSTSEKAHWRRAVGRKALRKWKYALFDWQWLAEHSSDAKAKNAAKTEVRKTKKRLAKRRKPSAKLTAAASKQQIDEVSELPEVSGAQLAVKHSDFGTFLRFEKVWHRTETIAGKCKVLRQLAAQCTAAHFCDLFANQLTDALLRDVVHCSHHLAFSEASGRVAFALLAKMSRVTRFEMLALFLEESAKAQLAEIKCSLLKQFAASSKQTAKIQAVFAAYHCG